MKNRFFYYPYLFFLISIISLCFADHARAQGAGNTIIEKKDGVWRCPDAIFSFNLIITDHSKKTRYEIPFRDIFVTEKEFVENVIHSSAGYLWGEYSSYFIANINKNDYFYIHTWNGKKILIDLNTGKIGNPDSLISDLERIEKKQIRSIISYAAKIWKKADKQIRSEKLNGGQILAVYNKTMDRIPTEKLCGALLRAASYKMTNLRKHIDIIDKSYTFGDGMSFLSECGSGYGLDTPAYKLYTLRRFAQLALRRMGFSPKGYPQIVFNVGIDRKTSPSEKDDKVRQIGIGLNAERVYRILGPPDYIQSAEYGKCFPDECWKYVDAWRYDIDSSPPYSLILIWSNTGETERIEKIFPPLWHGDRLFSEKMNISPFEGDGSLKNGIHLYSDKFIGKIEIVASERNSETEINKCKRYLRDNIGVLPQK